MLNKKTKKIIALGVSLATVTGTMPAVISPIPVFANEAENETLFNDAKVKLDEQLNKVEYSSATTQEDIDSILKDFSYTTTTGTAVTIKATTKNDSFSNDEVKSTCSFSVDLSDESDTKSFDYSYTYEKETTTDTNVKILLVTSDPAVDKTALITLYNAHVNDVIAYYTTATWNNFTTALTAAKTAIDNTAAAQSDVDTAKTNLDTAISGLKRSALNKTPMSTIYLKCLKIYNNGQGTYTKASWGKFISAYNYLKVVDFSGIVFLQEVLDQAVANLQSAYNGLTTSDPVGVDKSGLNALYNALIADGTQGTFTDTSWGAFRSALTDAKTVIDNTDAKQEDVDKAKTNLDDAIIGLVNNGAVDKSALIKLYGAHAYDTQGTYTTEKWTTFTTALAAAKTALTSTTATQNTIDTAKTTLQTAIDGLGNVTVDKTALQTLYDTNTTYVEANYTTESWSAFKTELTAAKAVLDSTTATQAAVDAEKTKLSDAINKLVKKGEVDKSALQTLYDTNTTYVEANYTTESWSAFKTELTAAKAVLDSTTATQAAVDAEKTKLSDAINGLVKKVENQYGTVITLTVRLYYSPIIIAGVDCSTPWHEVDANGSYYDPNVVVTKLNEANKNNKFDNGYKLISAIVEDHTENGVTEKRVIFKLGLADKLSTFPLTIASFGGNTLTGSDNSFHDKDWGIFGGMETFNVVIDKSGLQTLYDTNTTYVEANYTTESWSAFTTELTAAKAVLDDTAATQAAVDAEKTKLSAAINKLVKKGEADKSALKALYDTNTTYVEANYTTESWSAFKTELTAAKAVLDDTTATQAAVDAEKTKLSTAINGLVKKVVNQYGTVITLTVRLYYSPIIIAGVDCSTPWHEVDANGSYYDPNVVVTKLNEANKNNKFDNGYKLISAIVEDHTENGVTEKRVIFKLGLADKLSTFPLTIASFGGNTLTGSDNSFHDKDWGIFGGMETFNVVIDKSGLQTLYDTNTTYVEANYTTESWSAFTTELTAAKAVLDDTAATQAAVDAEKTKLSAAINKLVKKGEADKSALKALYDTNTTYVEANYTTESWSAFKTELTAAKAVLDDTTATQAAVDAEKTKLSTAINGLVKKVVNQYGTVITLTVRLYYSPIIIAGVDCSTPWHEVDANGSYYDPNVVVTKLNEANKNNKFDNGYKLISAIVEDHTENGVTEKRVIFKLGLADKLSTFPLTIASFGGNTLTGSDNSFHDKDWGIFGGMETFNVVIDKSALQKLYTDNATVVQGTYTDESWSVFTKALTAAKAVLDNKDATQDAVDTANTTLSNAINGLIDKNTKLVTKIVVNGADGISVSGGSITLTASVSPDNATNKNVTWSIASGTTLASLSDAGVLTASKAGDGSVTVRATAKDGSAVYGEKTITISNNVIIVPTPGNGGGSHRRRSSSTITPVVEAKSAEIVAKSTDESSILNGIKGAKVVVIDVNNAGTTTNTTLISANILEALKTNTDTTLQIKSEKSTIEVKATADKQIQFTENNVPLTGLKTVGNDEYYLNDKGIMQTGWQKLSDGTWYHFNLETGVKEKGWMKDPSTGKFYYLDDTTGAMKTSWLYNGGLWYYFNGDGTMKTGWFKDSDEKWYYLNLNGAMAKDTKIDGYYVDIHGAWVK